MELARENGNAFDWIGPHEPDEHQMCSVADVFGRHPLAMPGAVETHHRPKLECYDDTLVLVLKTVDYVEHNRLENVRHFVKTGKVMIAVGPDFVLTVRHGQHRGLAHVREQMQHSPTILKLGPYAVMCAIAEHVVDGYEQVAELVERDIDGEIAELAVRSARRRCRWLRWRPTTATWWKDLGLGGAGRGPTPVAGLYGMNFDKIPLEH